VNQEFLPDEISGTNFFKAGSSAREQDIEKTIENLWGDKYIGK
jgi:putative ATPase